ncbi:protein rep [uncultured Microbacterium sp.]|uniref:protein rep n=1 Tax=uncultured Microbacterium sp. TaxID=191216 RepID=UPI00344B9764
MSTTARPRRVKIAPETARYLGIPRAPHTSLDSSQDVSELQRAPLDVWLSVSELRKYQDRNAPSRGVRMCGVRGRMCRSARCARCSHRRAADVRARLAEALRAAPEIGPALVWTATVSHTPDRALGDVWAALDALLGAVAHRQWLTRNVGGYARLIEIEHTAEGWHVHAHTLLVFGNDVPRSEAARTGERIVARYLDAADRLGIAADASGQDVRPFGLSAAVGYVTKSHMTTGPTSTPGTLTPAMLLQRAARGDATADAMLAEIDRASRGRKLFALGGMLRGARHELRATLET